MSGRDDNPPTDGEPSLQEAFALIGNEVRAEIVRALGEAEGGHGVVAFSDLRSRVDPSVDSSQFNYHLQRLVGRFVAKTDDGYRLRPEGLSLYRTIVAGTFTRRPSLPPFEVGVDCYFCGAPVEAAYDDGQFTVECPDCGHVYNHEMAPPSAVDDERAVLSRVDQYSRHGLLAFVRGVCATCVGGVDVAFVPASASPFDGSEDLDVLVSASCDHCGARRYASVGAALLADPELVSFFHERGVDVTTTPLWEFEFAMTDRHTTVRSTDPWEVALELAVDGDALELVVDGDLNVVERNRR